MPYKPGWWHPLSSGPSSAWRRHSLSAGRSNRQELVWGPEASRPVNIACQRSDGTSKARTALAGSPLGPRREKWETWAHSRAGATGLSGNPPVQTLGMNRRQKMHAGPQPSWWRLVQAGVEFSFCEKLQLNCLQGSNWPCCSALSTRDRSQEGIEGGRRGFNLLAPLRNLMTQSCFPTNFPSTGSWLAAIIAT